MTGTTTLIFKCQNAECNNEFTARIIEHRGGLNDEGSWIVKCRKCKDIFSINVGRDVNDSSLTSGGTILGKYCRDAYTMEDIEDEINKFKSSMNKH